jgi:tryptophanyl-tRNA synthetase
MKRIITGIQSTGHQHIGNYFGAIKPTIEFSKTNETLLFIADIHSLTTIKDAKTRQDNTDSLLASLIALGFDYDKNILFKQSDVPEVCELAFYLSCFTPFNTLTKAHAFQEKSVNDVNMGLFTYPLLMAADILMYDADLVPVGKDQLQHLEITRTLANKFNSEYGKTFTLPEPYIIPELKTIIGTDGRKMSKSYNNYIDPFENNPNKLRKVINRIVTTSAGIDDPKDYESCTVFNLFTLFSESSEIEDMKLKYQNGVSYSEVKTILFEKIVDEFKEARNNYFQIIEDKSLLKSLLIKGEHKAREISSKKLKDIKAKLGF